MNFRIEKEGLINNESFIDELCAFYKIQNDFTTNIDDISLCNWKNEYTLCYGYRTCTRLSKKISNNKEVHVLVFSGYVTYQDNRKLIYDYSINISDFGKVYTTYNNFFKENNISDENYTPGFGNNGLELKQLGYSNWEFVGFGKHRAHNDEIVVIEKANHKILVGIDGLTIHGKKFDVQKLKSSFEFNNIWKKL